MKCFEAILNFEDKTGLYFGWRRSKDYNDGFPLPHDPSEWVPQRNIAYGNDCRLTERTKAELAKLWAVAQPKKEMRRDVIGDFTICLDQLVLFSQSLKTSVETLAPDLFEFVPVNQTWNATTQAPLSEEPLYIANPLIRVDAWDRRAVKIYERSAADGTKYFSVDARTKVVKTSAIQGQLFWRDALTNAAYCTSDFRDWFVGNDFKGLMFLEIPASSA